MLRLILFFAFITLTNNAESQKLSKTKAKVRLIISPLNSKVLFVDRLNMVGIQTIPETKDSLKIVLSQGSQSLVDKNLFFIQATELGEITISVYNASKENELVGKRKFQVVLSDEQKTLNSLSTKPDISLGGYHSGRIPIDTVKKINCLTINNKYKFKSATVYFTSSIGPQCNFPYGLNSVCFDNNFSNLWARVSPGTNITFDNVQIEDIATKKNYIIPTIGFVVVDNK